MPCLCTVSTTTLSIVTIYLLNRGFQSWQGFLSTQWYCLSTFSRNPVPIKGVNAMLKWVYLSVWCKMMLTNCGNCFSNGLHRWYEKNDDYFSQNFWDPIEAVFENEQNIYVFACNFLFFSNVSIMHSSFAGLNVYSMLKHETLILTLPALEKLEEKLLAQLHKADINIGFKRHSTWFVKVTVAKESFLGIFYCRFQLQ